jgi:hypothetical protein
LDLLYILEGLQLHPSSAFCKLDGGVSDAILDYTHLHLQQFRSYSLVGRKITCILREENPHSKHLCSVSWGMIARMDEGSFP